MISIEPRSACVRSPVAVFAFNRVDTLQKCLKALTSCEDFENRRIVIFCDGARPSALGEDAAVAAVRFEARNWAKTFGAEVSCQSENRGLRSSITSGVRHLLASHESVIVLEDDIITSRYFLRFMDQSLHRFRDEENVWQISGWFSPTKRSNLQSGFLRVPGCWGWATWRRAWGRYCDDAQFLMKSLDVDSHFRFNLDGTYRYTEALRDNAEGRMNTWQVRWYASMFLNSALAYYPGASLTRNIGFDSRGTNCRNDAASKRLFRQPILNKLPDCLEANSVIRESEVLMNELQQFLLWQARQWSVPPLAVRIRNKLRRMLGLT